MKVLVLGGGDSTERAVSLRSAKAVAEALKTAGIEIIEADSAEGLDILGDKRVTMVFPILHGQGGEDGKIQAELEKRNLPYLGTQARESQICFDKIKTLEVYKRVGLPTAHGSAVTRKTYVNNKISQKPHVLKISQGGSSIGTYIVNDPTSVDEQKVDEVFSLGETAVLEPLVVGVEITVPVLDNQPLSVIEIVPPEIGGFDYENKYNGATKEICPPKSVDLKTQKQAQQLALRAHKALNCRHLSRTDMMVQSDGSIVLLETNTMPGMTDRSLYPIAAQVAGLTMPKLMQKFVDMVTRDYDL